jgi:SAM-dependent methyltransferase
MSAENKKTETPTLDRTYWTNRWEEGATGWDVGNVSTPFIHFFEKLNDKSLRILIPGCGNGYEGEYLWRKGFHNVFILDISEVPLTLFKQRVPDFPHDHLLCNDFFELNENFELIIEQTFFCAINPSLRIKYVSKMVDLLVPGGKLAGLLFNFPLTHEGPPFGGSKEEYIALFEKKFEIKQLHEALDSIKPRLGRELWFEFIKR